MSTGHRRMTQPWSSHDDHAPLTTRSSGQAAGLTKRRPVPGKARVHELAKEFGVDSKTVLAKLKEQGEFVKSASSTVEAPVARRLREALGSSTGGGNGAAAAKPAAKPAAPKPAPAPAAAAPAPVAAAPAAPAAPA